MKSDPRRALLGLPQLGGVSEDAIRAAYWRMVSKTAPADLAALQEAKRALLFEVGVRTPARKPKG